MTRSLLSAAALGLLLAASAPSAFAQFPGPQKSNLGKDVTVHGIDERTGKETRSKTVDLHNYDLSTPEGAKEAVYRIRAASKHLCSPHHHAKRGVRESADYKKCVSDSMQQAVQSINSPMVDEAYKSIAR